MLHFPQLSSGALAQYPFSKRRTSRTVANAHPDGSTSKLLDSSFDLVKWQLVFSELTTEERNALESFFEAAEGRLEEFTFLDPTNNLLLWSEDLTASAWVKDPMLQLTGSIQDPEGTTRATGIGNTGGTSQRIQQAISAPAWFRYCFSFYARSDQPVNVSLLRSTTTAEDRVTIVSGPNWRRLVQSGNSQSGEEAISFGIELEAGSSVEVYGMQVEAQPNPSTYRKTTTRSGVYQKCRFDSDKLQMAADGPEQHSCSVWLMAPLTD
jgi:hypothetical protein